MNTPYKIALLGAFIVFVAVIGYYVLSGPGEPDETASLNPASNTPTLDEQPPAVSTPEPEPEPARPSLRPDEIDQPGPVVTIGPSDTQIDPLAPPPADEPLTALTDDTIEIESGEVFDPLALDDTPVRPGVPTRPTLESTGGDPEINPVAPQPQPEPRPIIEPQSDPAPQPIRPVRPVPPAPPSTSTDTPRTYTVKEGDMLSTIAVAIYGEERAWFDIAQANPSIDPKQLQIGQVLVLPNRDAPSQPEEVLPPAPGADRTYTVRPGDNLSKIAARFYGDGGAWDLIYARNRAKIGPRPDNIKVGMELIIPQPYNGAE